MIQKLFLNQKEKAETELLSFVQNKISPLLFFLLLLLLPTQFGLHTWPPFAFVAGQRLDYLSPTFYVTDILVFLLFLFSLPALVKKIHPIFLIVLIFLSIGIFLSHNPFAGWWYLVKFCEFAFVVWYVAQNIPHLKQFFLPAFGIGLCIEGILAFIQFGLQHSVGGLFYFLGERLFSASTPGIANASIHGALILRPYGTFSHPNVLAGYILMTSLLFFLAALQLKKLRFLTAFFFCFGSVALFITLSRLAIVGWIIGLFLILLQSFQEKKKSLIIASSLSAGLGTLLLVGILRERIFTFLFSDESFLLRLQLSHASLQMIVSHPLFGVGFHNFFNMLPSVLPQVSFSSLQPVHNIFLLIGAETGLVGLGIFLVFISLSLIKAYSNKKGLLHQWAFISLFIVCFIGLGDHYFLTLQQGQLLFSLLLGVAWSQSNT